MVLLMAISLYTSRVVLNVLGVTDFGIYNVVGGVVMMLGFVNSSLSGATSRFLTFELGKETEGDVKKIFRCSISIHYLLAIGILIVAETIGLWFVMNKLVIPSDKINAVFWVYQCSVVTSIISILSVPYNALIIAHERMKIFAYISIFEGIAKLAVVYALLCTDTERLILYAFLIMTVQSLVIAAYIIYCKKHLKESSAKWLWDKELSKKIGAYAGWTLNGNLAVVGFTQGINILLNLFFGPAVNAARGIAVQVQSAVNQFFNNFLMAVRPQITKSYAKGDLEYMHTLIINSSRYAFFLIILVALPILVNTEYILQLWLGIVPEHTVAFTQLMIVSCMNMSLSLPVGYGIHATGDIKKFQIVEGTLLLTIVPVCYILLKHLHISPEMVFVTYLIIEILTQFVRVWLVYPKIKLHKRKYFTHVLYPIAKVVVPLTVIGFIIDKNYSVKSFSGLLTSTLICLLISAITIYFLGMKEAEKEFIISKIKKFHK